MSLRCLRYGHNWGSWKLCPMFNGGSVRYCRRCPAVERRKVARGRWR